MEGQTMTIAYKFLATGGVGPFTRVPWPPPNASSPGAWVVAAGPVKVARCGAHVCDETNLAHWLHDELWIVEIDGQSVAGLDCLVVARARLVRRVRAWTAAGAAQFATACIAHAEAVVHRSDNVGSNVAGLIEDARTAALDGYPTIAAYSAALAVARQSIADPDSAYTAERAWQSAWIRHEMIAHDLV